jgi:hypothetical protein
MDRNQHVKDYVKFYVDFPQPPRFAVLLNGPWGIGKTFLIKQIMATFENTKHLYVSLNGLSSIDDIDGAIMRALFPIMEKKNAQIAGRVLKSLAKHWTGFDLEVKAKDVLENIKFDVFIFDDLERCEIPVQRVLGYLNEFVEHDDEKVIIIANETEIDEEKNKDYRRIREKLIGKTLEIQSAFEEALAVFIKSIRHEGLKEFFSSKSGIISELYLQSSLQNLRILQQAMWDFERVYASLEEPHKRDDGAMTTLLGLLFAFSFELKAVRLNENHLANRRFALVALHMASKEGNIAPLLEAQKRYPEVRLDDSILSDKTLGNILVKGIVDGAKIRRELNTSSYFVVVVDEPAWRTVWHAFSRTEEEFNAALSKMEQDFAAREYTVIGEILHVFGIRIWLSRIDALPKPLSTVISEGKSYVDDLSATGRLELPLPGEDFSPARESSFDGLGYMENGTAEYIELYQYLSEKRKAADIARRPEMADDLLATMASDTDRFLLEICLSSHGPNLYYNVPVFASLAPEKFVEAFFDLGRSNQRTALTALKARYENGILDRELSDERCWAVEVRNLINSSAEAMSPISKYIVRSTLSLTLDVVLALGAHAPKTA